MRSDQHRGFFAFPACTCERVAVPRVATFPLDESALATSIRKTSSVPSAISFEFIKQGTLADSVRTCVKVGAAVMPDPAIEWTTLSLSSANAELHSPAYVERRAAQKGVCQPVFHDGARYKVRASILTRTLCGCTPVPEVAIPVCRCGTAARRERP